jgi:hypothetical protein
MAAAASAPAAAAAAANDPLAPIKQTLEEYKKVSSNNVGSINEIKSRLEKQLGELSAKFSGRPELESITIDLIKNVYDRSFFNIYYIILKFLTDEMLSYPAVEKQVYMFMIAIFMLFPLPFDPELLKIMKSAPIVALTKRLPGLKQLTIRWVAEHGLHDFIEIYGAGEPTAATTSATAPTTNSADHQLPLEFFDSFYSQMYDRTDGYMGEFSNNLQNSAIGGNLYELDIFLNEYIEKHHSDPEYNRNLTIILDNIISKDKYGMSISLVFLKFQDFLAGRVESSLIWKGLEKITRGHLFGHNYPYPVMDNLTTLLRQDYIKNILEKEANKGILEKIIKLVTEYGFDDILELYNVNPIKFPDLLHIASRHGQLEVIRYLVSKGYDINHKIEGMRPVGWESTAKSLLIELGADTSSYNLSRISTNDLSLGNLNARGAIPKITERLQKTFGVATGAIVDPENAFFIGGHGSERIVPYEDRFILPDGVWVVFLDVCGQVARVGIETVLDTLLDASPFEDTGKSAFLQPRNKDAMRYLEKQMNRQNHFRIYGPGDHCPHSYISPSNAYNETSGMLKPGTIKMFLSGVNKIPLSDINKLDSINLLAESDDIPSLITKINELISTAYKHSLFPTKEQVLHWYNNKFLKGVNMSSKGAFIKAHNDRFAGEIMSAFRIFIGDLIMKQGKGIYYNFVCRARTGTKPTFQRLEQIRRQSQTMQNMRFLNSECVGELCGGGGGGAGAAAGGAGAAAGGAGAAAGGAGAAAGGGGGQGYIYKPGNQIGGKRRLTRRKYRKTIYKHNGRRSATRRRRRNR